MTDGVIDAQVVEPPSPPPPPPAPSPAPAAPAQLQSQIEDDDTDLVDQYEDLVAEVDKQITRVGGKVFMENMQKFFAKTTAKELENNTYQIIKKVVMIGGITAVALERLEADFEDLKDEVVKHSRLFNDLMSTSIIAHSLNLARLCLERVQDTEIRNLAQAIHNSMHPTTTEAVNGAAKSPTPPADIAVTP